MIYKNLDKDMYNNREKIFYNKYKGIIILSYI